MRNGRRNVSTSRRWVLHGHYHTVQNRHEQRSTGASRFFFVRGFGVYESLSAYIESRFKENFDAKSKKVSKIDSSEIASAGEKRYFDFTKLIIAVCDGDAIKAKKMMQNSYIDTNIAISMKMQQWAALERISENITPKK